MHQTERTVTIALECDRSSYLEKLSHTRDTHKLFKFFKNFKPDCPMPSKNCHGSKTAVSDVDKVNLLNQYFQSVFSADESFDLNYMESFSNTDLLGKLNSFDTSPVEIEHILNSLDVSKTRGPDSLPPCFFRHLSSVISLSLSVLKIIKRTGSFPSVWKVGAISPMFESGSTFEACNYRPITLLNVVSKVQEMCFYDSVYDHCIHKISKNQHSFLKKRSIFNNLLPYLENIYKCVDERFPTVSAFYSDFAKASDKVPLKLLLAKMHGFGIRGEALGVKLRN